MIQWPHYNSSYVKEIYTQLNEWLNLYILLLHTHILKLQPSNLIFLGVSDYTDKPHQFDNTQLLMQSSHSLQFQVVIMNSTLGV